MSYHVKFLPPTTQKTAARTMSISSVIAKPYHIALKTPCL